MGDLHGAYKAMKQCMHKAGFDYENDRLIFLGDIADSWSQVPECIEEFTRIRNLVALKGNHDVWLEQYLLNGEQPDIWLVQGGIITVRSYEGNNFNRETHLKFLQSALPYFLDGEDRLFVHAGFNPDKPVEETDNPPEDYYWSRDVYQRSFLAPVLPDRYREIYIGHTPTTAVSEIPLKNHNVWLMDQGAAWKGFLSMLNLETKEYYQSDRVTSLYPDESGRSGLKNIVT